MKGRREGRREVKEMSSVHIVIALTLLSATTLCCSLAAFVCASASLSCALSADSAPFMLSVSTTLGGLNRGRVGRVRVRGVRGEGVRGIGERLSQV